MKTTWNAIFVSHWLSITICKRNKLLRHNLSLRQKYYSNISKWCFYHPKFATNDLQLSYFSAVSQINNIFDGNLDICNLYCYCQKCERDGTEDVPTYNRCSTLRMKCYDKQSCTVSAIWRHWKLSGYKPRIVF